MQCDSFYQESSPSMQYQVRMFVVKCPCCKECWIRLKLNNKYLYASAEGTKAVTKFTSA